MAGIWRQLRRPAQEPLFCWPPTAPRSACGPGSARSAPVRLGYGPSRGTSFGRAGGTKLGGQGRRDPGEAAAVGVRVGKGPGGTCVSEGGAARPG